MAFDQQSWNDGLIMGSMAGITASAPGDGQAAYEPRIWNDTGVYTYFYIDFKQAMESFSLGMFHESIIVYDSGQIVPTAITFVSPGVYKIYANISNLPHGLNVMGKEVTRLAFATGTNIPPFSVHMFVAGQDMYSNLKYCYDSHTFLHPLYGIVASTNEPTPDLTTWSNTDPMSVSETANNFISELSNSLYSSITETAPTLVLT